MLRTGLPDFGMLCPVSDIPARMSLLAGGLFCVGRLFRHVLAAGVETLFIPFSYAGDGGNPPRIAKNPDRGARRMRDGGDDNGADDLRVDQQGIVDL